MSDCLLRVDAVNLSNFVFDSQDLSVIRGGGLYLLRSSDSIFHHLETTARAIVTRLINGASSALARVQSDLEPSDLESSVRNFLAAHPALRYATFSVSAASFDPAAPFGSQRDTLTASNRWQQMQSPSLAYPDIPAGSSRVCDIDHLRPATRTIRHDAATFEYRSALSDLRHEYGRSQKGNFYKEETGGAIADTFVNDFESLAGGADRSDNLNDKLALIYIDGNRFGSLQAARASTPELQQSFSSGLRDLQRRMLAGLLASFQLCAEWRNGPDLRFETLLWGGDEIEWVTPAWTGWQTLSRFFALTQDWRLLDHDLTHSASIVFFHRNAPIAGIRRLAHSLVDMAKDALLHYPGQNANLFAFQVLESFDDIGRPIDLAYLQSRHPYFAQSAGNPFVFDASALEGWSSILKILRNPENEFPRRKLVQLAGILSDPRQSTPPDPVIEEIEKRCSRLAPTLRQARELTGGSEALWLHLAELWDYAIPAETPEMGGRQ